MQAVSGLLSLSPSLPCSSSKKSYILRVKSQYSPTAVPSKSSDSKASKWAQKTVVIPPQRRGCHLVTSKVLLEIEQDLAGFKCGLANFFLQHTSASLTINENYDSDVQADTETFLCRVVPEVFLEEERLLIGLVHILVLGALINLIIAFHPPQRLLGYR